MLPHTLQSKARFDGADRLYKMVSVLIHLINTSNLPPTQIVSGIGSVKSLYNNVYIEVPYQPPLLIFCKEPEPADKHVLILKQVL